MLVGTNSLSISPGTSGQGPIFVLRHINIKIEILLEGSIIQIEIYLRLANLRWTLCQKLS